MMKQNTESYIRMDDLSVGYNGKALIREICIDIKKGEIVSMIGPNGAGKSTILKSITRQLALISGKVLFPVDHNDLLPVGSVQMNGVKFYGQRQPEEIIAYTTAVIAAAGGSLEPVFTGLLDSRNGMHYDPKEFRFYDGGIGGVVNGEPVLVGTLDFLRSMGVEIPEGIRVRRILKLAGGEVTEV